MITKKVNISRKMRCYRKSFQNLYESSMSTVLISTLLFHNDTRSQIVWCIESNSLHKKDIYFINFMRLEIKVKYNWFHFSITCSRCTCLCGPCLLLPDDVVSNKKRFAILGGKSTNIWWWPHFLKLFSECIWNN